MRTTLLIALLLSACSTDIGPTGFVAEERPEAMQAALDAWIESFGPTENACQPEAVQWALRSREEVHEICDSKAFGCYLPESKTIVIQKELWGSDNFDRCLTHELMHWLSDCNGWGADHNHEAESLWGENHKGGVVHRAWELAGVPY